MPARWRSGTRRASVTAVSVVVVMLGGTAVAASGALRPALEGDEHSSGVKRVATVGSWPDADQQHAWQGGDLAFWGDVMVAAHGQADEVPGNEGFAVFDVSSPRAPRQLSTVSCTGSGYDVSIYEDLVLLSQDEPTDGPDCAAQPASPGPGSFAGLRVISIADPRHPVPLAAVLTNCAPLCPTGSHTHTLLPDLDHEVDGVPAPRLIVYASGIGTTVVEVPLADPAAARVIGRVVTAPSAGCHDIQILLSHRLAACAGINETQLWDVSAPEQPVVLSHITNPLIEHHHSGVFSYDGRTLAISDEQLTTAANAECLAARAPTRGALWFYDVSDPLVPVLKGSWQTPHPVVRPCFAHYADVVPTPHADVLTIGWGGSGSAVIDFSDPSQPRELAYYLPDGRGADGVVTHQAYWYGEHLFASTGRIYGLGRRGIDVYAVKDELLRGVQRRTRLNPQLQEPLT